MRKSNPHFIVLLVLFLQGFMEFNLEYSVMGLLIMLCLNEKSISAAGAETLKRICVAVCGMVFVPL